MDVQVKATQANPDVKVVLLSGGLDIMAAEQALPAVMGALDQSAAGLIMDLDAADFIGSAWLRLMLAVLQKAGANGKQIAIIRAHPAVYKVFKISKLDKLFQFFKDESEAVKRIWPSA